MGCKYCYGNQGKWDKPGYIMSEETAQKSIETLFDNIRKSDGENATITFFGGEPLLRFDFIKNITNFAKFKAKNDINLRFATITNGTTLKKEHIDFFKKEKFVLSLSLDGNENQHDVTRVYKNNTGTYSDIMNNFSGISNIMPVLIRTTISDHNYNVNEVIQHINSLGFKRIMYELDFNIDAINFTKFLNSSEILLDYYIDKIKQGEYFDLRNFTRVIASILTKRRSKSHCDAGVGYMAVSADGQLYPCHRFIGMKELSFGNISELNTEQIIKHATLYDKQLGDSPGYRNSDCIDCQFAFLCGGGCAYHSYLKHNNLFEISINDCQFKRTIFDQTLRLICELKGNCLSNFVDFLKRIWHEENGFN
ncbi:MAG TPA: radical SAM protein, partial [bacterium]|nr:radical SAM protein [bacterium]